METIESIAAKIASSAPRVHLCPEDGRPCHRRSPKPPKIPLPQCKFIRLNGTNCPNRACAAPHEDHPQRGYCNSHAAQVRRGGPDALADLRYRSPKGTRNGAKRIVIEAVDGMTPDEVILAVADSIRATRTAK